MITLQQLSEAVARHEAAGLTFPAALQEAERELGLGMWAARDDRGRPIRETTTPTAPTAPTAPATDPSPSPVPLVESEEPGAPIVATRPNLTEAEADALREANADHARAIFFEAKDPLAPPKTGNAERDALREANAKRTADITKRL